MLSGHSSVITIISVLSLGLNKIPKISYPEWSLSWFSLRFPWKRHDPTANYTTHKSVSNHHHLLRSSVTHQTDVTNNLCVTLTSPFTHTTSFKESNLFIRHHVHFIWIIET